MKKIAVFLICLISVASLEARDYVFKTKLYGNWILNDATNTVSFQNKNYAVIRLEETNSGYKLACILGNEKRLFEIYATETNAYLIEYQDQADIYVAKEVEKKEKTKPTISHDGFGELDVDEMIKTLAQDPDYFYRLTNAPAQYRQQIIGRVSEILQMAKRHKMRISASGEVTFGNPGGVNDKYKSTGTFNKKRGKIIYDENTINNFAYYILCEVARNTKTSTYDYFSEIEAGIKERENKRASLDAWKRGNSTNIKWVQVLKTEIIIDTYQPQQNEPSTQEPQQRTSTPQNILKKDPNFKIK